MGIQILRLMKTKTCFHSADSGISNEWWMVDLGGLHMIINVTLFNRNGGK